MSVKLEDEENVTAGQQGSLPLGWRKLHLRSGDALDWGPLADCKDLDDQRRVQEQWLCLREKATQGGDIKRGWTSRALDDATDAEAGPHGFDAELVVAALQPVLKVRPWGNKQVISLAAFWAPATERGRPEGCAVLHIGLSEEVTPDDFGI